MYVEMAFHRYAHLVLLISHILLLCCIVRKVLATTGSYRFFYLYQVQKTIIKVLGFTAKAFDNNSTRLQW